MTIGAWADAGWAEAGWAEEGWADQPNQPEALGTAQSDVIAAKLSSATNWALWRCNEASGNLSDFSGNGHTLIARGTPTYGQAALEGSGIFFDGLSSESATAYVIPMGSSVPNTFTMGFNVKGNPQASKALFSVSNGASAGTVAFLTGTSAGVNDDKLRVQVQNSSSSNVILGVTGPTILDNTWHNVIIVGSGGNSVIAYIDGVAQSGLSGTWSSSRPSLKAAAIAGVVLSDTFPQYPSSIAAITVENAFVADVALSPQDIIDIYNAGAPDIIPPELATATVALDGNTIVVEFDEIGSPPILPSTGITGFSFTRNNIDIPISSVSRTDDTQLTFVMGSSIPPGISIYINYSGGNLTDSLGNSLEAFSGIECTNNSVIETYAKISLLASTSDRMAPHTVWVTASKESVPISGVWRYCAAEWDFGNGASGQCINPINNNTQYLSQDQTSYACASYTYEQSGEYTITLRLTGSDGVTKTDTATVTILDDSRTIKYLSSSASPSGDGSESTPWSTHAEMASGLTSNTTVLMDGTFNLDGTSYLPVVSNVWFKPASGQVVFHWTDNPAVDSWVFGVPSGAENIFIDGKIGDYTSRGIIVTSDIGKSITKSDNQTGFLKSTGSGVKCRNVYVSGDINDGGMTQGAFYGGHNAFVTHGMCAENCTFGDCNNYLSVFTRMEYVCWLGIDAGTAWIEHTQRWLSPASKYIGEQWCYYDHKRVGNGIIGVKGQAAKDCIRFQSVEYATATDCVFTRGVIDYSYPWGVNSGEYGPGHYIQINRCIIDDCGIYIRPDAIDCSLANCYIKEAPFIVDIGNLAPVDKVMDKFSILHNTFVDTSGTFSFLDFSVLTNTNHAFDRTNIDVVGNLFCTASGQTGDFIRIDDVALYDIFDDISNNVMTDGLSVYVRSKNATTQTTTTSFNWTAFTGEWPNNTQDTIMSNVMDSLEAYRPIPADNPNTITASTYRPYGILARDLLGFDRPSSGNWYAGAVDAMSTTITLRSHIRRSRMWSFN